VRRSPGAAEELVAHPRGLELVAEEDFGLPPR
jgi:hypothetical protein